MTLARNRRRSVVRHVGWLLTGLLLLVVSAGCFDDTASNDLAQSVLPGVERPAGDPVPRDGADPANVVLDWLDLHLDLVRREAVSPPVATRVFGYASVAMQAAAALASGDRPLAIDGIAYPEPDPGTVVDPVVTVTAAAAGITRELFPSRTAVGSADALEAHQLAVHGEAGGAVGDVAASMELGQQVADAVLARAATDGYDTIARTVEPAEPIPGTWEPTPPGFERAREPGWGNLLPLVASDADCPVPDPIPYSEDPGSAFYAEAMAVRDADANLTDEQRATARYWNDRPGYTFSPSGHWVHVAGAEMERDRADGGAGPSLLEAATTYALVSVAQADTFIANWAVKYRTNVIRPVTYLQRVVDPDWLPVLITPPFPEYPSGHSSGSAASATVLTTIFGNRPFIDSSYEDVGRPARPYDSYEQASDEASTSRLYGGIHFPMALAAGQQQGRCIAGVVLQRLDRGP